VHDLTYENIETAFTKKRVSTADFSTPQPRRNIVQPEARASYLGNENNKLIYKRTDAVHLDINKRSADRFEF